MRHEPTAEDDLNPAEQLGVLVGAAYGTALAERDVARRIAVALEQDLAQAEAHLAQLVAIVVNAGTTWAHDAAALEAAQAFLNRSPE